MKSYPRRLVRIIGGLFLYAVGLVINMNANLGYAPWEIFHYGVGSHLGLTIGNISVLMGLVICLFSAWMGEIFGFGTVLNMIFIGVFMDLILAADVIPQGTDLTSGLLMMICGFLIIALATCLYLSGGMGAGPRDGLIVVLQRRTGQPVGICRAVLETTVALLGWALGGPLGIGTVFGMFGNGLATQIVFHLLRFDATKIRHENLEETIRNLKKQKSAD